MWNGLIDKFKERRRNKTLNNLYSGDAQFAFLGVGQHSMHNLYPAILHLGLPVKFIYSRTLSVAEKAAAIFPRCTGTDDLQLILHDPAVAGVFICMKNEYQLPVIQQCLAAGKYVFVEKPAVTSLDALRELIRLPDSDRCMIAFNKRFNPMNSQLRKKINGAYSYHARYATGSYPEGDPVMELFCHPIDNVLQLFGPLKKQFVTASRPFNGGVQVQLLLEHQQAAGILELSTCYSWGLFRDTLSCLSKDDSIELDYPGSFSIFPLEKKLGGIPSEKIFGRKMQAVYTNQSTVTPLLSNKAIVQHGYADEIRYFSRQVQQQLPMQKASPVSFLETFLLLERIKGEIQ